MSTLRFVVLLFVVVPCPGLAQGVGPQSPRGTYTVFGSGCRGSGGMNCTVLPKAYATRMGEGANAYPHARSNMRYQQVFLAAEIGPAKIWNALCLRLDERFGGPAIAATNFRVLLGKTKNDHRTLSAAFASNYAGTMTRVFSGTLNVPVHTGSNRDPSRFDVCAAFARPFAYTATAGQNLLVEMVNGHTAALPSHFLDKTQGNKTGGTTTRLWAFSTTATTGSREVGGGLVMCLRSPGSGRAVPALANTGVPEISKSFSVDIKRARVSTAAALVFGFSNTRWGVIPLPFKLDGFGATGCSLLVSYDLVVATTTTDARGEGKVLLVFPNDKTIIGVKFWNQFIVVDPVNALGLVVTNGGEGKIGG